MMRALLTAVNNILEKLWPLQISPVLLEPPGDRFTDSTTADPPHESPHSPVGRVGSPGGGVSFPPEAPTPSGHQTFGFVGGFVTESDCRRIVRDELHRNK